MNQRLFVAGQLALLLFLVASSPTLAQTSDSFDTFSGTWSGVFTTQDSDFWGLEDFTCSCDGLLPGDDCTNNPAACCALVP